MDGPLQKTVYKNGVATLVPMTTTNTTTSNAPPNVPPVIPIAPEQVRNFQKKVKIQGDNGHLTFVSLFLKANLKKF